MNLAALLDSFDEALPAAPPPAPAPADPAADAAREAERLASYESGYRSGWDDCLAAEQDNIRRVSAELARNLSDLGFTYHEARAQLLAETEALLDAFFRTVWPRLAGQALARRLVDDVAELAGRALDMPVELVVSAADAPTVRALLTGTETFPLNLVEEDALAEGQAHLRFGRSERVYDMNQLADRLCEAIAARATEPEEQQRHG
jgi:flagellar biosynthesis/type III secretory pathway protein FliH